MVSLIKNENNKIYCMYVHVWFDIIIKIRISVNNNNILINSTKRMVLLCIVFLASPSFA